VLKHGDDGIPHIEHAKPDPEAAVDNDSDGPDDQGVEEPWDKRVKHRMDKHGISHDAAVSMLHRAEKVSKGI
jgi:hypothetical protein